MEGGRKEGKKERKKEREKEREKKRQTRGWSKGVLINMVWAYMLSYKIVILGKIKIKIPDLQNISPCLSKRESRKQSLFSA